MKYWSLLFTDVLLFFSPNVMLEITTFLPVWFKVMFFLRGVPPGRGRSALAQAIVDTFSQNSVFCCSSQTTSVDVSDQNCLQEVCMVCLLMLVNLWFGK